jgi:predicted nucleotidyltransferase
MRFGLTEKTIQDICRVFAKYSAVDVAILYGSRAKGNYRKGSDIDLTLQGAELSYTLLLTLTEDLDELLLPYKIDLSIFHLLEHSDLKEHIERVGQVFYRKEVP